LKVRSSNEGLANFYGGNEQGKEDEGIFWRLPGVGGEVVSDGNDDAWLSLIGN
jgi:hypothetical protein